MTTKRPGRTPRAERPTALIPIDRRRPRPVRRARSGSSPRSTARCSRSRAPTPSAAAGPPDEARRQRVGRPRGSDARAGRERRRGSSTSTRSSSRTSSSATSAPRSRPRTASSTSSCSRSAYDDVLVAVEMDIVLGLGYLLTAHEGGWDPLTTMHLRRGASADPGPRAGPPAVGAGRRCHRRLLPVRRPARRRHRRRSRTTSSARRRPRSLERLFVLKRELIDVRRAVSPVREVFNQLTNRDTPLIDDDEIVYFRDVYDHLIRLTDELDNYRELARPRSTST